MYCMSYQQVNTMKILIKKIIIIQWKLIDQSGASSTPFKNI